MMSHYFTIISQSNTANKEWLTVAKSGLAPDFSCAAVIIRQSDTKMLIPGLPMSWEGSTLKGGVNVITILETWHNSMLVSRNSRGHYDYNVTSAYSNHILAQMQALCVKFVDLVVDSHTGLHTSLFCAGYASRYLPTINT